MNCRHHSANAPASPARIPARAWPRAPDPVNAALALTSGLPYTRPQEWTRRRAPLRVMSIRTLTGARRQKILCRSVSAFAGQGRSESAYVQVRPLKTEGNTMQPYRRGLFLGGSLLAVALAAFLLGG